MEAVVTSAQRAASLTHRLLAFSRRQPLDPKSVDVNALIGSMEDLLRRTLGEQTTLRTELAARCLARAERRQPARKRGPQPRHQRARRDARRAATSPSSPPTRRSTHAYAARHADVSAGDFVTVSVSDTGVGMDQSVMAKAFDPFFTTKPIGQGTGLGLSMIYGFMQQTDGHVRIYSDARQGCDGEALSASLLRRGGPGRSPGSRSGDHAAGRGAKPCWSSRTTSPSAS